MLSILLFLENIKGAGYNAGKPKTLYKYEPITITLTPGLILAGLIMFLVILVLGFGSVENYNFLLSGV